MYLVVSHWKAKPSQEQAFEQAATKVAGVLREQPGMLMLEVFKSGDRYVSVHGYKDEATYQKLINDPQGAFSQAQQTLDVEQFGDWLGSERGATWPLGA